MSCRQRDTSYSIICGKDCTPFLLGHFRSPDDRQAVVGCGRNRHECWDYHWVVRSTSSSLCLFKSGCHEEIVNWIVDGQRTNPKNKEPNENIE